MSTNLLDSLPETVDVAVQRQVRRAWVAQDTDHVVVLQFRELLDVKRQLQSHFDAGDDFDLACPETRVLASLQLRYVARRFSWMGFDPLEHISARVWVGLIQYEVEHVHRLLSGEKRCIPKNRDIKLLKSKKFKVKDDGSGNVTLVKYVWLHKTCAKGESGTSGKDKSPEQ